MDDWGDWVVDSDPTEVVRQMRGVLSDRDRSRSDKLEALSLLANLADESAIEVLRWYDRNADPGMHIPAMLALQEAVRLNREPRFEPWHDALIDLAHEVGGAFTEQGRVPSRAEFLDALAEQLDEQGWAYTRSGRALLKYDGLLIDMLPVDMVVRDTTLVGLWDRADMEAAWAELEQAGGDEGGIDPLEHFYALLRSTNLPFGLQVDISGEETFTDLVENLELDRGVPRVEYLLSFPADGGESR